MAPVGTHLRRGVVATLGALLVGNALAAATEAAEPPTPSASPVAFYTPVDGGTTAGKVHVVLGADPGVTAVQLAASTNNGASWQPIGGRLLRRTGSTVFETTWQSAGNGPVRLRATGYDSAGAPVGVDAEESVTLAASASRFAFTSPGARTSQVGVFKRADGRWFAAVSGTTTGAVGPVADAPLPPTATATAAASRLRSPSGVYDSAARTFTVPVELSAYAAQSPAPKRVPVRLSDGTSTEAVDAPTYPQTISAVRSTTTTLPGTRAVTITTRVTDQYGQPVAGAPVRLVGYSSGAAAGVRATTVTAVTDVLGLVAFPGPGTTTGYPTGYYTAYVDLDLDRRRDAGEPGYQTVVGTVSFAAPGRAFYHNNTPIAGAGGVVADSLRGTRDAAAHGYTWIDQDGQLSYRSHAALRRGSARVSRPADLSWVNAHGAPFNPRWLRKGRFETHSWSSIRRHRGLRNAVMTFKQNAVYGISVEWEVKDIRPFTTKVALDAAFTNLAAAAQRAYGTGWQSRVQVKMLSSLSGGQARALKVLRSARAHGFTTIYLARGNAARVQIPASAHRYVTYVRGARSGLYAPVPPVGQDAPVVVTGPPPVTNRP
ncbi:hypothetical protein [Nocardioides sp. URHA0020]|uniref:hypothetical protein n=1 Tax=Nocardioides sp. URHA0020 TaxID=1380392 RepID=UPI00048D6BAD|nr:hypothetical protein [Nocardioides sp. URHA0020]